MHNGKLNHYSFIGKDKKVVLIPASHKGESTTLRSSKKQVLLCDSVTEFCKDVKSYKGVALATKGNQPISPTNLDILKSLLKE